MRLLLVSQYFYPEVGATQTRVYEFAKHLARRGHHVTVIAEFPNHPHGVIPEEYHGKWFERDQVEGFNVIRVWVKTSTKKNFKTRLAFYLSFMVMAILGGLKARGKIDAVFATSPPLFVGVSGWVLSLLRRARFVLDVRDLWPEAAVALGELSNPRLIRAAEKVERFLYRRAHKITTVTKGFMSHIGPNCGDDSKLAFIPNGTITEIFNPDRKDPTIRPRLGLEGKFVVTFAGTMGIAQGMHFLLDLAKSYIGEDDDIRFLFIGDGPLKPELAQRIEQENITNVLLHPQVPLQEVTPYLTMSDVLLVPLRNDPVFKTFIPSKMFDFLACGRPIILGVDGEARDLLSRCPAGIFARPESLPDYRSALTRLRRQTASDLNLVKSSSWVLQNLSRSAQAAQLETTILSTTTFDCDPP